MATWLLLTFWSCCDVSTTVILGQRSFRPFCPRTDTHIFTKYCDEYVYVCRFVCLSACLSFCLSVCPLAYLKNHKAMTSPKNFMHAVCGCGSVVLWRCCDTLRTSGFVDDVTFSLSGPLARRVHSQSACSRIRQA